MKREIRLQYLLDTYGKERFLNWCRSLKKFRFIKSHSYPDDFSPDRFIALAKFNDVESLQNLLILLNVEFIDISNSFSIDKIESTFSGEALLNEMKCRIDINMVLKTLLIEVNGTEDDQFTLDDSTFKRAKKIDEFLQTLSVNFISSPYNDDYCITPEFYPEVWKQ